MAGARILVKLAAAESLHGREMTLGAAGSKIGLKRVCAAPTPAPAQGATASTPANWYLVEGADANTFGAAGANPWDAAHSALRRDGFAAGVEVVAAEPDIPQSWPWPQDRERPFAASAGEAANRCVPDGQKDDDTFDKGPGFAWHLGDAFSGLKTARSKVGAAGKAITIVHLDTGYDPDHIGLPEFLDTERQRNFVEGGTSAVDTTPTSGLLKNRGHGTGTVGILAGGNPGGLVRAKDGGQGLEPVPREFGPIGGAPMARIVPVRVANSVVHFWTSAVAQGIDHARQIGADVLSMSMGGLPSSSWADAVNAAYEAGVVLVCAAGNSFGGLPTSLIVYPARFDRVIAACGVMVDGRPYHDLGGPMEGNVGPASKMATAMTAYTPNIPWLRLGCGGVVDMDGAGTSSATPQIAAAAALWLAKHGDPNERSWRRVEQVRAALFQSAKLLDREDAREYFGRGLLQADAALALKPSDVRKTAPDDASFAFLRLLTGIFGMTPEDPRQHVMFGTEITQIALLSPAAREAVPDPDAPPETIPERQQRRFIEAVIEDPNCSMALRSHLERVLGRSPSRSSGTIREAAPESDDWATGADIPRPVIVAVPSKRRLRVFATDPGDSTRLATSFVNVAQIEVPWERLERGPVGEYLEVIDVDPASDAAYDPVDLDNPYLLAQDGHAPSEGNPQFHQQMVYAVAMRTIRNFETALGRRALWSERRIKSADGRHMRAPNGGYVQRLRIYPHALRERNAFYSPDKKALLFGYFGENDVSGGRRTIFTCLAHDIVAHETTHALLDGLHRRFQEPTNPDVLAFHEAFADIVAIFQHFTFPELLRYEIARLRGDLGAESMLADLARQFGKALHNDRALRSAIDAFAPAAGGESGKPPKSYVQTKEPHERGAILLAAVFDAFVAIYKRRTEDLYRIATGGTGILQPGAIHPDLVERLARTAVEIAQRILILCIRALDYMPPVDPTFGDYLRALVTADADFAPDHGLGYRVAFAEAFNRRGVYPPDIMNVGPDSLLWQPPDPSVQVPSLKTFLRSLDLGSYTQSDRRQAFESARANARELHGWLRTNLDVKLAKLIGLDFRERNGKPPRFEVHSVRPARRMTADGEHRTDVVAVITQRRNLPLHDGKDAPTFTFRGGVTLLLDREYDATPIRYAIARPVWNERRADRVRGHLAEGRLPLDAIYGEEDEPMIREPFAIMHAGLRRV